MPPPALVASQARFSSSLSAAVEIVRRRDDVQQLEDQVRAARQELADAVGGVVGGGEAGAVKGGKRKGAKGKK